MSINSSNPKGLTTVAVPEKVMRRLAASVAIDAAVLDRWAGSDVNAKHGTAKSGEVLVYGPIVNDVDAAIFEAWFDEGCCASNGTFRAALNEINGDVLIRVNSPGGDVMEASGMLSALIERQAEGDNVSVVIDGLAASAASFFATLDDVKASPMASVMIHKSWAYAVGNSHDLAKVQQRLETIDASMAKLYSKKLGLDVEAVMDLLNAETWYSAESAVKAGLVDSIIGEEKDDDDDEDPDGDGVVPKTSASEVRAECLSKLLSEVTEYDDLH